MPQDSYVTVKQAAAILGVSPSTVRNWDKTGRLPAVRDPRNRYRVYRLRHLIALQRERSLFDGFDPAGEGADDASRARASGGSVRTMLRALHRIIRDGEGSSSIIERFDELTKLLYCKVCDEQPRRGAGSRCVFQAGSPPRARAVRALFRRLVAQRPNLFPARFTRINLGDATLERVGEAVGALRLSAAEEDVKGVAYEELIRNTFDKGENQQFFTPRPLVEFMVQMVGDRLAGRVCDPACGTGGFLLYVDKYLRGTDRAERLQLEGFEVDERLAWVAGINLDMHGARTFSVRHLPGAGSLGESAREELGQFDVVITNPPFGSDLSDRAALDRLELGRGRASRRRGALFVERCVSLLKPAGVLAIIIDDGVLNAPSNRDVRTLVCRECEVVAIASLPETAFMPYASVKASILVLQKRRGGRRLLASQPGTFFARAEVVGRKPNGEPQLRPNRDTGHVELDSDLPDVLHYYRAARGARHGWECTEQPATFCAAIPSPTDADFARDGCRVDLAYHHPSRLEAARALAESPYATAALAEVCGVRNDAVVPCKEMADEDLTYIGLANIEADSGVCTPVVVRGGSIRSACRRFVGGDLLFAKMRPELRKVCLIPEDVQEGLASSECLVLAPRRREDGCWLILPELLSILLRTDLVYGQLTHLVTGIGRPRLSKAAVLSIRLPVPPPAAQERLLQLYRRSEQAAKALADEAGKALMRARRLMRGARGQLVADLLGSGSDPAMADAVAGKGGGS